jgi:GNAT superfamily N-acetyltransferase
MLIRPPVAADIPALVGVFSDWGHPQPGESIAARLELWAATPHAEVLVAELDGAVAGVAAVAATPHLARSGSFGRLVGLAVAGSFRRRGVGASLVRAAEAQARDWGCDRLEATSTRSRDEAPAFYLALGYEDRSERQRATSARSSRATPRCASATGPRAR